MRTCVVCKKFSISGDNTRSFHKFPCKDELKKKWLLQLGISSVTKSAAVCSDHFDDTAYHQTDGYTFVKRLMPNAVPLSQSIIQTSEKISNSLQQHSSFVPGVDSLSKDSESMQPDDDVSKNTSKSANQHLDNDTAMVPSAIDVLEESRMPDDDGECHASTSVKHSNAPLTSIDLVSTKGSKRKSISTRNNDDEVDENNNEYYIRKKKKIKFTDGYETKYISQKDFVSEEAWECFLRYKNIKENELKNSRIKNYRACKKVQNLHELINSLRKEENVSAAEYLEGLPENVKELINRMKKNKKTVSFPPSLQTFARTLHFHSPAAYDMVRRTFLKCLPCIETLSRWNCSKNYKPGICSEIIEYVSKMALDSEKNGKQLVFNITFDEMNIKKCSFYCKNSHEWKGLVDFGGQLEEGNDENDREQANKALVFMLVNINGSFKTPIAYYFNNSMSGNEKCVLLKDILIQTHENKINVVSVTFDGDESNQKACKILGANFDYSDKNQFHPFFPHPVTSENVFVFFDPCHMIKLVRNYFALKGPLFDKDSCEIDWRFIKLLNDYQYAQGMHCACKIKNRHVHFLNEKMKVFLAVQVLSSSTSLALTYFEKELKLNEFQGSSATAQFCKNFNDAFDLLNTKNLFCKTPGRKALTVESLPLIKTEIDRLITYIETLTINVPNKITKKSITINNSEQTIIKKSVLDTKVVRTGFVGLIISLKNLVSICEMLFNNKIVSYFLSYKISQDHVEMLFALIRRMNGFTNNPTTVQFTSALKKLLLNNMNVSVPASANCTPQDLTLMISDEPNINDINKPKEIKNKANSNNTNSCANFPVDTFLHCSYPLMDHDYTKNDKWFQSEYLEDIIKHTAGFTIHSLKKKIHCADCLQLLFGSVSSKSKITIIKNRGGLQFASDDVYIICLNTEKVIRRHKKCLLTKHINFTIVSETLKILPKSIFDNDNHQYEQEVLHDHRQQLIYLIVQHYLDTRLKHESDKINDVKYRIRMYYNKMTIFKGQ